MPWWGNSSQDKSSNTNDENVQTFSLDPRVDPSVPETPQSSATDVSSFLSAPGLDVSKLHPLAGLNQQQLEYLSLEDESSFGHVPGAVGSYGPIPIKDWTDDLCYGTGAVYLTGLGVGGLYGLSEGLRKTADASSAKLRLNGVLNAVTRRGPFLGNTAGVLALTYNLINSAIGRFRGEHDAANSLASGALAGALFRVTHGPRAMLMSSSMVAAAAGVWCLIKGAVF